MTSKGSRLLEIVAWLWVIAAIAAWLNQFAEIWPTVLQVIEMSGLTGGL